MHGRTDRTEFIGPIFFIKWGPKILGGRCGRNNGLSLAQKLGNKGIFEMALSIK